MSIKVPRMLFLMRQPWLFYYYQYEENIIFYVLLLTGILCKSAAHYQRERRFRGDLCAHHTNRKTREGFDGMHL